MSLRALLTESDSESEPLGIALGHRRGFIDSFGREYRQRKGVEINNLDNTSSSSSCDVDKAGLPTKTPEAEQRGI